MGRNNKYESHVKPRLKEISEWFVFDTERQIAKRLGVSPRSFENYKKDHAELREALSKGIDALKVELKGSLKKKALGYYYNESERQITEVNGERRVVIKEYKKYAQPDTGAIHLLLKNYDDTWRNDDLTTIEIKKEKLALEKEKSENNNWG